MKERLITFTRSDKNVEDTNQKCMAAFLILGIIVMFFSKNIVGKNPNIIDTIIAILLDSIFLITLTWMGMINTLSKKKSQVIRDNSIIKILLANGRVIEIAIVVISMMVVHFYMCIYSPAGTSINVLAFLIGSIIIVCFDTIVSSIVSQYFEKKLKK